MSEIRHSYWLRKQEKDLQQVPRSDQFTILLF